MVVAWVALRLSCGATRLGRNNKLTGYKIMKETLELVGKQVTVRKKESPLFYTGTVEDVKMSWGKVRYLVKPDDGSYPRWVNSENVNENNS